MLNGGETLLVVAVALIYGVIRCLPRIIAGVGAHVSAGEAVKLLDSDAALLIDVRRAAEYFGGSGHIPGAVNIPLPGLSQRLKQTSQHDEFRDRIVITVCQSGTRAAFAVRILKHHGFPLAKALSGGISAWEAEGFTVVPGNPDGLTDTPK